MADRSPSGGFPATLRSMSDEVLLRELGDTYDHLTAAGLEADADVVSEVARRWATLRDGSES